MRNEMTLALIKERLHQNCGDLLLASRAAGVSLAFVNQWRKDDPEVDTALNEAVAVGRQGLISAAIQRGVRGVEEDVYYKGEVVGSKTVYSDGLLTTLLKTLPEFQKDGEGSTGGVTVNIANIMPRAENYEQWQQMKEATLNRALEAPSKKLEAPAQVVEAEYAEVNDKAVLASVAL